MTAGINSQRIQTIRETSLHKGTVVYWMSRDQRADDNWALLFAQSLAFQYRLPLAVVFCLSAKFLGATQRQYGFMLKGLEQTERRLREKNIPFFLLTGQVESALPSFLEEQRAVKLIADFNPLRISRRWKSAVEKKSSCSFYIVDAHNIVPCWTASQKQEFGAYTIRPKLYKLLPDFLDEFPPLQKHPFDWPVSSPPIDWGKAGKSLTVNTTAEEIEGIIPGAHAANQALKDFLSIRLGPYGLDRNDPVKDGQSNLSPYFHFGQIAPQRAALEILKHSSRTILQVIDAKKKSSEEKRSDDAFLEELIVRRELSDNFIYYNDAYDSFDGFPSWAQKSLNDHRKDKREYLYSLEQFESGSTHDELWNAAQKQMLVKGKMHGYMRMYWAKKILEWTASPEEAMMIAIHLNDTYELDGRDPNGYAGIAWSIGGVHDRAWFDRPVFGKVRYMNYNGCASKFDIEKYIGWVRSLEHSLR